MSVFQLHDWWRVKSGGESEEFDHGCMALGNVDNAYPPSSTFLYTYIFEEFTTSNILHTDKIVVASQQGVVRIYNPTKSDYRGRLISS